MARGNTRYTACVAERTRILREKDDRTLAMPGARLLVTRGPDRGRAVKLEREELVVGTSPSAHLQLADEAVSRNHFALRVTDGGFLVTDLESTNGTFVGGRRVRSIFVELGDTIEAGDTRLRLEAAKQSVELALARGETFGRLLGRSVAARRLFALLEQVAREDVTVLLTGETGTGKDACAEALHEASARADKPFVVFDCSAVAPSLLESELFGHEKGAFTGANARRKGVLAEADGGTLFLDEIGELPRELQPKLLRALEKREARPVGADRSFTVDVRLVAATNRDLKLDVNRGAFREDLYYRLSVIAIRVPPLRERADDVELLADHFWREATGDRAGVFPRERLAAFVRHVWPGNVRELRNRVERAALLDRPDDPSLAAAAHESFGDAKQKAVDAFERSFLTELLVRAKGNVSEAARLASMDRIHLTKLMRKHGLKRAAGE